MPTTNKAYLLPASIVYRDTSKRLEDQRSATRRDSTVITLLGLFWGTENHNDSQEARFRSLEAGRHTHARHY